ncbi:hypothetical protein LB553_25675 [Mesorhizobium sp. CA8]|uniref:hypothetical protein n=1 Tax=unclassified Mesorhizobium TaxID=325217 RepID=UPI001CCCC5C2|nr:MULTISPECIES: hypothetical protein [unclassified Mesorhizobium]MBZ9764243.1 hypothetical protein [Mesorhizobium sp. CA8]MBZ9823091.1 hypothetical protein [Mesorhizobium sp. CA4]
MKTRELGHSGLTVSALALGCMGMSINYGAPRDKVEMIRPVRLVTKSEVGIGERFGVHGAR